MRRCDARGLTIIELTVMLAVLGILAAALIPSVSNLIGTAKLTRARSDVNAIKQATIALLNDTQARGLVRDGSAPLGAQQVVDLLVSDGDIPSLGRDGDAAWLRKVDFSAVDFMEYHLCTNRPGGAAGHAYEQWNGAYLAAPIGPDPWGNRYMINSQYLASGNRYDVVVISAGPDEEIDSAFTQDGFLAGDDDIVSLISSGMLPSYRGDGGGGGHATGPGGDHPGVGPKSPRPDRPRPNVGNGHEKAIGKGHQKGVGQNHQGRH